jgi:hypothetical protein
MVYSSSSSESEDDAERVAAFDSKPTAAALRRLLAMADDSDDEVASSRGARGGRSPGARTAGTASRRLRDDDDDDGRWRSRASSLTPASPSRVDANARAVDAEDADDAALSELRFAADALRGPGPEADELFDDLRVFTNHLRSTREGATLHAEKASFAVGARAAEEADATTAAVAAIREDGAPGRDATRARLKMEKTLEEKDKARRRVVELADAAATARRRAIKDALSAPRHDVERERDPETKKPAPSPAPKPNAGGLTAEELAARWKRRRRKALLDLFVVASIVGAACAEAAQAFAESHRRARNPAYVPGSARGGKGSSTLGRAAKSLFGGLLALGGGGGGARPVGAKDESRATKGKKASARGKKASARGKTDRRPAAGMAARRGDGGEDASVVVVQAAAWDVNGGAAVDPVKVSAMMRQEREVRHAFSMG